MSSYFRILANACIGIILVTLPAKAVEYQCQLGDSSLRLAIEVGKDGHTLPCEVVAEDDKGEHVTLFRANYDRDYCPTRIEKRRAEIEEDGWTCRKSSDDYVVRGTGKLLPLNDVAATEASDDKAVEGQPEPVAQLTEVEDGQGETTLSEAKIADNGAKITDSRDGATDRRARVRDRRECRRGVDVRRLMIEVDDPESGKPCNLIYWAEDDTSEEGKLLWRAEHDADFCPTRLGFIMQKWSDDGWECDDEQASAAVAEPDQTEQVPVELEPVQDTETASLSPPAVAPEETSPALSETTSVEADVSEDQAATVDPKLQAIIEADAKRIGEWMEVEPAIEVAARGDLNDDGNDDAVVFLAYESDHAAYRQYLMSYLVADESYELASVKLLTGVNPPPAHAKVKQIDKGVIWLSQPNETGDEPIPTGYVLRDQQLVEIDNAPPTAAD